MPELAQLLGNAVANVEPGHTLMPGKQSHDGDTGSVASVRELAPFGRALVLVVLQPAQDLDCLAELFCGLDSFDSTRLKWDCGSANRHRATAK